MNIHVEVHGKFPRCTQALTVVLHDRNGAVHHVHQALVFESKAAPPTSASIEAVARRCAAKRGAPADLLALHLAGPLPGTGPYRVDVARGVLLPR